MLAKLFPRNEHLADRAVRVLLGVGLLAAAVAGPRAWWGWLGVIPLVTGLVSSCPVYRVFGVSTCSPNGS